MPVPRVHSLRGRLFAAFAGVLLLSLVLTAATFWLQIRLYNTQQVRRDLQVSAPTVFADVKHKLIAYWYIAHPNPPVDQEALKAALSRTAHTYGVRILLTDYCDHVPVDTGSNGVLSLYPGAPAACSRYLDDLGATRHAQPLTLNFDLGCDTARQTDLLGGAFYVVCLAPRTDFYALPGGATLQVRTIIIAKSPGAVDQSALSAILPRLVVAGIFAVLLTLLVVLLIVGAITRPLRTITAASERMAAGDYDQQVPAAGTDEVGQLARSFNRMASEVSGAREMQRQFIANVSHDLKTPLTSILGFSQILADEEQVASDPTRRRAVQVINEEARRLQRLTLDLLELSRLEAGQLQLRRVPCDLQDLAAQALARYADLPANANLHFERTLAAEPLLIMGDADRMMQVLVNLLDNAVKFCNPGGSVAIRAERRGAEAVLTVANTGVGIAADDLARVFQRFYRTDHSRATRTGGTGLGLAIVRELVAAHGGHVEASSDADGWTRFVVALPLLTAGGESVAADPRPAATSITVPAAGGALQ